MSVMKHCGACPGEAGSALMVTPGTVYSAWLDFDLSPPWLVHRHDKFSLSPDLSRLIVLLFIMYRPIAWPPPPRPNSTMIVPTYYTITHQLAATLPTELVRRVEANSATNGLQGLITG